MSKPESSLRPLPPVDAFTCQASWLRDIILRIKVLSKDEAVKRLAEQVLQALDF